MLIVSKLYFKNYPTKCVKTQAHLHNTHMLIVVFIFLHLFAMLVIFALSTFQLHLTLTKLSSLLHCCILPVAKYLSVVMTFISSDIALWHWVREVSTSLRSTTNMIPA